MWAGFPRLFPDRAVPDAPLPRTGDWGANRLALVTVSCAPMPMLGAATLRTVSAGRRACVRSRPCQWHAHIPNRVPRRGGGLTSCGRVTHQPDNRQRRALSARLGPPEPVCGPPTCTAMTSGSAGAQRTWHGVRACVCLSVCVCARARACVCEARNRTRTHTCTWPRARTRAGAIQFERAAAWVCQNPVWSCV